MHHLEFEKPVLELEGKIAELKHMTKSDDAVDMSDEIARLETKAQRMIACPRRRRFKFPVIQSVRILVIISST